MRLRFCPWKQQTGNGFKHYKFSQFSKIIVAWRFALQNKKCTIYKTSEEKVDKIINEYFIKFQKFVCVYIFIECLVIHDFLNQYNRDSFVFKCINL